MKFVCFFVVLILIGYTFNVPDEIGKGAIIIFGFYVFRCLDVYGFVVLV